jgi:hypothetical protein
MHQAIRPDLADIAEASHHFAPHYAEAAMWRVTRAATVVAKPDAAAEQRTSLVQDDKFALLDLTGGWAWGKTVPGNIVGYVEASALEPAA